jgi:hypothetical protein
VGSEPATTTREVLMAFMLAIFDVGDFDQWKERFDSDPVGRKEVAKRHRVFRAVDNPSEVFVSLEFGSDDEAKAFREKLLASGVLDTVNVEKEPTVAELVDETVY